jgi:ribosomal-protein-alanine N-acetyltransferase
VEILVEDTSTKMLNDLYEIEKKCFEEEAFSKQQIGYLLRDYNTISKVVRKEGKIAGFIISRIDVMRNESVGHIMTIDVLPEYRRQGIAFRLMLEVEAVLKNRGINECRLEVREGNAAAIGLYKKLGYKKIVVLENYYRNAHGLYLRKRPL